MNTVLMIFGIIGIGFCGGLLGYLITKFVVIPLVTKDRTIAKLNRFGKRINKDYSRLNKFLYKVTKKKILAENFDKEQRDNWVDDMIKAMEHTHLKVVEELNELKK